VRAASTHTHAHRERETQTQTNTQTHTNTHTQKKKTHTNAHTNAHTHPKRKVYHVPKGKVVQKTQKQPEQTNEEEKLPRGKVWGFAPLMHL